MPSSLLSGNLVRLGLLWSVLAHQCSQVQMKNLQILWPLHAEETGSLLGLFICNQSHNKIHILKVLAHVGNTYPRKEMKNECDGIIMLHWSRHVIGSHNSSHGKKQNVEIEAIQKLEK